MNRIFLPLLTVLLLTACQKETMAPGLETGPAAESRNGQNRITLCHYSAEDGSWHLINVPPNALAVHLAHGDLRLDDPDGDGYVPENSCGYGQMGDCDDQNAAIHPGAEEICYDGIDQDCDGQSDEDCCNAIAYPTVELNGRTWLAQNLDIDVPGQSWYYNNDPATYASYGRLYTWQGAQTACAQLGDCWRVPTDQEWREMAESFGGTVEPGSHEAYVALIEGGSSGFNARLGGIHSGDFASIDVYGYYWSATENTGLPGWAWNYTFRPEEVRRTTGSKTFAVSCRCILD